MPRCHPLYDTWCNMRRRCDDPSNRDYARYGGRGITYSQRWNSFVIWLVDIPPHEEGKTFDRIDTNGDYEPGNVRWATLREQANNRHTNVFYEIDGSTKTLAEWAEYYGLDARGYKRAHERMKNGWEVKKALTHPPREGNWCRSGHTKRVGN